MRIRKHINDSEQEEKIKIISHKDNNKYHDFLLVFPLFKDYGLKGVVEMKNIIKSIVTIKKFIRDNKSDCDDNFIFALKDAVEEMKYRCTKKPIKDYGYYYCPCCNTPFPDIEGISECYNFCPECGQAIDYDE